MTPQAPEGDVDGEGDPVALAIARTRTFGHRAKVFLVSTPTIKGLSRIEREFEASDQRRFFVPCPHCGVLQWLYERREDFAPLVPRCGLILTAGADVQHDRIEVDVWAWGRRHISALVDHIVLEGDTSREEVWGKLTAVLGQTWAHESGARMRIARLAIDSGDGRNTAAVYAWVRRVGVGQALAIKGVDGFDRSTPVDGPTYVDVNEYGRTIRRGVKLWKVSVAVFKSETYRFLRLDRPTDEELAAGLPFPDGFVHIPKSVTAEWVKQLVAEQLVTVRDRRGFSKLEWRQMRERNEALDCRVYARAAAWLLGIDRFDDARFEALEEELRVAAEEDTRPLDQRGLNLAAAPVRRSDWLGRRDKWL